MPAAQTPKLRVIIAGGGVAALEATLALHELAADHVDITVLTAATEFSLRPLSVREPFDYPASTRHPVAAILEDVGAQWIGHELASVDAARHTITTTSGQVLAYDALLIACGGRPTARYEHAVTINDATVGELLESTMDGISRGFVESVAFVAPPRIAWPLALYDIALMAAQRAADAGMRLKVTIITPESNPLGVFGDVASDGVAQLLASADIDVVTLAHADIRKPGLISVGDRQVQADAVIALPELFGPAIPGLPTDELGFTRVDELCRVPGNGHVYAAGDAANYPIKLGGIASQMADTAARGIAALAGASVTATPLDPILRGMLLTGRAPVFLYAHRIGDHAFDSEFSARPTWDPPSKISSHYLAPYLEAHATAATS